LAKLTVSESPMNSISRGAGSGGGSAWAESSRKKPPNSAGPADSLIF